MVIIRYLRYFFIISLCNLVSKLENRNRNYIVEIHKRVRGVWLSYFEIVSLNLRRFGCDGQGWSRMLRVDPLSWKILYRNRNSIVIQQHFSYIFIVRECYIFMSAFYANLILFFQFSITLVYKPARKYPFSYRSFAQQVIDLPFLSSQKSYF